MKHLWSHLQDFSEGVGDPAVALWLERTDDEWAVGSVSASIRGH